LISSVYGRFEYFESCHEFLPFVVLVNIETDNKKRIFEIKELEISNLTFIEKKNRTKLSFETHKNKFS